jgi:AraC-like DNA-binding protein
MAGLVPPTPPLRFTTRGIPEPSRRRALHELSEQGLLPVVPLPDCAPRVDLVKWRLPGASVLSGTFVGVRQDSGPASAGPGEMFFGINVAGCSLARQLRQEITIGPGDAVVIDPQGGAFAVARPEACQLIGIRIPRRAVSLEAAGSGRAPLRLVPGRTAALQLLTRYLGSVLDGPVPSSAALADAVVTHLTDLIELSLCAAGAGSLPARDPAVRAARLDAIKADVDRHLTDSSLTIAALAARHGITPRYLHKLFEDEAMTYSRFVLDRRLALAYRRLRHRRFADRTISSIAHEAGFGDLSYFNRTFRRRYSITPSDARQQATLSFPPGSAGDL